MHRLPVMSSAHPPPLPLHRSVLVLKFDFPSFQAEEEEDANHHPVINQLRFGDGQGRQVSRGLPKDEKHGKGSMSQKSLGTSCLIVQKQEYYL
ncbi:hypothetical protein TNCV_4247531 [Trichonephila clavipes]|nr:hypothetical protein TNCV_4247531 [Trichonephila clavipes]